MSRETVTTLEGVAYRDLNGNGVMDPYEDPRLTPEERVADLLPRLSAEEKAGLLFHTVLPAGTPGDLDTPGPFGPETPRDVISGKLVNHFNAHTLPSPREAARWHNALQELAASTPHGIPITFSSDPRHGFADNVGMALAPGSMSQWPEPLGLAAIGDPELVQEFGDIVRREYLAVGIRAALHPQVDLATEPRWARQAQTFGQDAGAVCAMVASYLRGLQGQKVGADSIACTTKHFPGGGAQKDGEDPHFPYGREQVYPGDQFQEHLAPFRAAIDAGTSAIMPYYSLPAGLELDGQPVEEVAFGFNHRIITGLLREELGFDGVVLTDWGLITDLEVFGLPFPAKAWGVEHLSPRNGSTHCFAPVPIKWEVKCGRTFYSSSSNRAPSLRSGSMNPSGAYSWSNSNSDCSITRSWTRTKLSASWAPPSSRKRAIVPRRKLSRFSKTKPFFPLQQACTFTLKELIQRSPPDTEQS